MLSFLSVVPNAKHGFSRVVLSQLPSSYLRSVTPSVKVHFVVQCQLLPFPSLCSLPEGEEQRPHLLLRFPLLCLPRERRQAGSHILQAGDPPLCQTGGGGGTPTALPVARVRRCWWVRGGGDRWRFLGVGWVLDGGGGGGGGCGYGERGAAGEEEGEVGEVPSSVERIGDEGGEI